MKISILVLTALLLTGCEQSYRYPCQNPDNWDKPECNKPLCEVNRDCPDLIFKENNSVLKQLSTESQEITLSPKNGECK